METAGAGKSKRTTKAGSFRLIDVEKLDAAQPEKAVKEFEIKSPPKKIKCDLLIAGGGMGGVAAAIAACTNGLNVCLTEQTSWLGGQMTTQGVSAFDENCLVETSGATRRYKEFRQAIRDHYLALGARGGGARFSPFLDPGNCWVSRLAFEPKVAVRLLSDRLRPFVESGKLQIFPRTAALNVRIKSGRIRTVQCTDLDTGKMTEFRCRFCIDATELGDLLVLAGLPYSSGAESKEETGEAHAPLAANPENVQDFTYPFVVEFCPGENHLIEKPPHYDEFVEKGKFSLLGYRMFGDGQIVDEDGQMSQSLPFWEYRRLVAHANFSPAVFANDIAMINWDSNDLRGENIIDKPPPAVAERLALGKFLSLGFLYWLQTEVQRDDGKGKGYPELKLRSDMLGTADGVSKYPYIRESRRIKALYTIVESDLTVESNPARRAKHFSDSIGIGHYPVDIHGTQDVPGAGQATRPFQIPAAALVQSKVRNLLPACKNIGTTHVTNGAYRLHPIEWAIGEAAGTFAGEALSHRTDIKRLLTNRRALRRLQDRLVSDGAPIFWFDDVLPEDAAFAAIQFVSACSLMPASDNSLSFRPDQPLTRLELAQSLARLLRLSPDSDSSRSIVDVSSDDLTVSSDELQVISAHRLIRYDKQISPANPVLRRDFAQWLYGVSRQPRFFGKI